MVRQFFIVQNDSFADIFHSIMHLPIPNTSRLQVRSYSSVCWHRLACDVNPPARFNTMHMMEQNNLV